MAGGAIPCHLCYRAEYRNRPGPTCKGHPVAIFRHPVVSVTDDYHAGADGLAGVYVRPFIPEAEERHKFASTLTEKKMGDTVFLPSCPFAETARWDDAALLTERAFG